MKATHRTKNSSGRKGRTRWLLAGLASAGGAALLARRARRAASPDPGWFAVTIRTDPAALTGPDQLARLAERHEIRITTAPGGRGAELAVRHAGGDARQTVRAIKQLLETGEVLVVEGRPEGRRTALGRAAQPALRQAIHACRKGGTVSVLGVHLGVVDTFPMGALMNKGVTMRGAQQHGHRCIPMALDLMSKGELSLEEGPRGYELLKKKQDGCVRAVFRPAG